MRYVIICLCCLMIGGAFALAQKRDDMMRRVECVKLIVYTPIETTSDEQVCAGFGGRLVGSAGPRQSMTILVKNQPVGGAQGLKLAWVPEKH